MATILRAYNDVNEKFDLDLFNEEAFLLDISAIESGDIGKVFGISSQTFALPATDNNTAYFGNLDNLGATPSTSFIKTLPCQVLSDGQMIFQGNIYLENVITDNNGDTIYNVNVVNETIDFKYQIADRTFGDLDWTDYNHDLTFGNITSSWDNNLFSGDIVYPLAEYGVQENDTTAVLLVNGGDVNTFTNNTTPLLPYDFKPAVRLRTIFNKIFENTNYSYTSSFLNSAYMDSVYVLATQDESRTAGSFVSPISQSFQVRHNATQTFTANSGDTKVLFNTEIYDNGNTWNTTQSKFTATTTTNYSFELYFRGRLQGITTPTTTRKVIATLYVNGSPASYPPQTTNLTGLTNNTYFSLNYNVVNLPLTLNDYVEVYLTFISADGAEYFENYGTLNDLYFKLYQGGTSIIGQNVNIGGLFKNDEKLTDFLNGAIQKFNLVIEPTRDNPQIISIETFNDWASSGSIVDWTDKVDRSVKFEITHPLQNNPKDIRFSDLDDNDYFNKYSKETLDKTFGEYNYFSESDLADGERKIGSYFAPTPMRFIDGGATNFIVPQIYSSEFAGETKKRMVFKPRLLHYLGKKTNNGLNNKSSVYFNKWFFAEGYGIDAIPQDEYPAFHHINELPATSATLDLHFGNLNHWEYHQAYVNAETQQDAFYTYWAEYVNELYDIDSRLLTLNVDLKPTDIPNIKLNDKIFIDGHYYRINKISGANLTNEQSTKVELIKVLNRKLKYPRRRIAIGDLGGNDYQDVMVKTLSDGGRVEYVDFNTDVPITSSFLLSNASSRDGFRYFSGSNEVVWQIDRENIPTNNSSRGVNYIDERAYNVDIIGNGNTIGGYVKNSTIVGENNNLLEGVNSANVFGNNVLLSGSVENAFVVNMTGSVLITDTQDIIALNPVRPVNGYDNNKVVLGNTLNQGSQYETYNNIECYAGLVYYLTGSAVQDRFHYHFSWSGSNGTATIYINDSTSPAYDGLQQRFTADGTLTASNVVNIIPISGTIDGGAEEALTTPYDGMTAQVINGDWQVIQRKK